MKALYCHDNMYIQAAGGAIYSPGQFGYEYWAPHLEVFDHITVASRGRLVTPRDDVKKLNRSDGPRLTFKTLPNMNSLHGLLVHKGFVSSAVKTLVEDADVVILRTMSEIGWLAFKYAQLLGKPVAVEMGGCPFGNTWNHGSVLAKLYAPVRFFRTKHQVKNAHSVLYVTKEFLQKRYPASGDTTIASNVRLLASSQAVLDKRFEKLHALAQDPKKPVTLGLIGVLDQPLKGIDVAIEALAQIVAQIPRPVLLRILGPGNPAVYEGLLRKYKLHGKVLFDGTLTSGQPVLDWLDNIDLYIQPSFYEGVPRGLLEAMSRGCMALGSRAGGIPELLEPQFLHRPGNRVQLAFQAIQILQQDEATWRSIATRNYKEAQHYTADVLTPKRQAFWKNFATLAQQT